MHTFLVTIRDNVTNERLFVVRVKASEICYAIKGVLDECCFPHKLALLITAEKVS